MRQLSATRAAAILRDARIRDAVRYVDIAISLRVCDLDTSGDRPVYIESTDEELIEVGGRWDRRRKQWAGDATKVRILRVPRGSDQEQPARWLAEWFRRATLGPDGAHWDEQATIPGKLAIEFKRVWTLMLVGGRRGGKSHLGIVALVMLAVLTPRSWTWAISPTQDETAELEEAILSCAPHAWFTVSTGRTNKTMIFKFVNGSKILLLSGHKPRTLKRGRVDVALYNEAQNMYKAGWTQLRGAIVDRGGLVIIACNPASSDIGRWVEEVFAQARAGKIAAISFHFRGKNNPFVTASALEDMRRESDDVTARKEIDGEMGVPIGDVVMHAWSDVETIRDVPPNFIDITAEETARHFGRAYGYIVGMDFQKTPHMVASIQKLFRDPADVENEILLWIVDEVVVDDANEDELVDGLEKLDRWLQPTEPGVMRRAEGDGYRGWIADGDNPTKPVHCVVVMDASGFYQSGDHQKGQRSDRLIAARKWTALFRPQKDSNDNPRVSERVKVANTRMKTAGPNGKRRMFSCRHNLRTNHAMRQWQNHKLTGAPDKNATVAHVCDATTYPPYRLFAVPRVKSPAKPYHGDGRFSRGAMYGTDNDDD